MRVVLTKKKSKIPKFVLPSIVIFFTLLLLFQLANWQKNTVSPREPSVEQNGKKIAVSGVEVNDFTQKNSDEAYTTIDKTKDYHIFYIPTDDLFFISIASYPFEEHRPVAEEVLLEKLGINQNEACVLNVDITTPSHANPEHAGKVYDLSFCENE